MRLKRLFSVLAVLTAACSPVHADSLSASLGATNLNGLTEFSNCQNQAIGFREGLIGDRLEQRLTISQGLNQQERQVWMADIQALKAAWQTHTAFRAPDPQNSQRYLMGLTNDEQVAINSIYTRYTQEVNLKCEQQRADEEQKKEASKKAMADKFKGCADMGKGLRVKIMAQFLEKKLESSKLSGKAREEFQADIQSMWVASAKGLESAEPLDPKNPVRAMMRLDMNEQLAVNAEYQKQYMQIMQNCVAVPQ